jgi:epsilon-lactone hydrolase
MNSSIVSALALLACGIGSALAAKNLIANLPASPSPAIHVKAFDLPVSNLLTSQEQTALRQVSSLQSMFAVCIPSSEPPYWQTPEALPAIRRCLDQRFYGPIVAEQRKRYNVRVESRMFDGVAAEVITPAEGIPPKNRRRVLLNLHGGGFAFGSRSISLTESIPIAASGKIKVVSVDYRMTPEYEFPAASEDVTAVYRELLKEYSATNIGIYGCSAGALLTAQTVAWLQKEELPLPGAVGMFCAGADYWSEGDSGQYYYAWTGTGSLDSAAWQKHPYFKGRDPNDPLVFPVHSAAVIAKFPPSLLITSTRDLALSSVVYTHSRLVAEGVEADLHVWEGLGHGFLVHPELPQSREAYDVIVRFFDKHLTTY